VALNAVTGVALVVALVGMEVVDGVGVVALIVDRGHGLGVVVVGGTYA